MNQEKAIERSCCQSVPATAAAHESQSQQAWSYMPPMDVVEHADAFTIEADLPGVTAESLEVTYDSGALHIHGTVSPRVQGEVRYVRQEYGVGDFDRSIPLGRLAEFIDGEHISATLNDGVVSVRLPKLRSAQPKRIEVRAS